MDGQSSAAYFPRTTEIRHQRICSRPHQRLGPARSLAGILGSGPLSRASCEHTMSTKNGESAPLAYENPQFLNSPDGRILRIMSEYAEPLARFRREQIQDTVVFFGSARFLSSEDANKILQNLPPDAEDGRQQAQAAVNMARYYEDARRMAFLLSGCAAPCPGRLRRFVVPTGGGPGIKEAANLAAREARSKTVGLNIRLPFEHYLNPYITPLLNFEFHYFFMRKFWFA